MLDRISPRRVLKGVFSGLKKRSADDEEKADIFTRIVLFGLPLAVAGALIWAQIVINEPEIMLAAVALLVGALLAGFSQVASWRERILERGRKIDAVRVKSLNEAGALILMSIHSSVLASITVFCVALLEKEESPSEWIHWLVVVLSSIGPAALAYVALSLVVVANLLWDGFTNEQADMQRRNLKDFDPSGE
ncbi:hypothetical protein [Glutamicibacter sp.]|uniref:hypothetical protein n=1 Tax=Glutamicibacter sp. TaxID=1931995 RepID=UPI003D6AEAF5